MNLFKTEDFLPSGEGQDWHCSTVVTVDQAARDANQKVAPLLEQCMKMKAALEFYETNGNECGIWNKELETNDWGCVSRSALQEFNKYLETIKGE